MLETADMLSVGAIYCVCLCFVLFDLIVSTKSDIIIQGALENRTHNILHNGHLHLEMVTLKICRIFY